MVLFRDGDRERRHAKVPVDGYRRDWREKVIYANDMSAIVGQGVSSVGVSPCVILSMKGNTYAYADLKMPIDRVPGTPMKMKLVYCTDGGGGNIGFYVDLLVASMGSDLTTATGRFWMISVASPANIQNVSPTVTIESVKLDGFIAPVEFQLEIGRDADIDADTSTSSAYVFKAIFEYIAYV